MPQDITLPFGALNALPGPSGIEDVEFSVPDLQDIITAIEENTLGRTQLDEAIGSITDQLIEDIWSDIEVWSQVIDGIAAAVVSEFEEETGIDVPGEGSVIDGVVGETPSTEDIDEAVQNAVSNELDNADLGPVDVNIEGIFGPLSEDLARALEDILNFDPATVSDDIVSSVEQELGIDVPGDGPILQDVPTGDDVDSIIESQLESFCPSLNGVNLCNDPIGFAEQVWDELKESVLGSEARQELMDALDEG